MLKKRLLLVLAIGVSFAPPVFAVELPASKTDMRGVRCGLQQLKKELAQEDQIATTQSSTAHSALVTNKK
jgi:hypothetical protein